MEVNRVLFVCPVEFMTSDTFKETFSLAALAVRYFLESGIIVDFPATRSIYEIMESKADTRSKPLGKSTFDRNPNLVLNMIGIEEM